MKVIDLIYKIANGEEVPQKIIYEDEIYKYREDLHDYENEYPDFEAGIDKYKYLFEDPYGRDYKKFFNDNVEVTEEDREIEILRENNQAYQEELCKVWEERDNAYRIINELENWFKDMNIEKLATFDDYDIGQYNAYKKVINKLQELKGSDKE